MSLTWTEAARLAAKGGPADRLRRWLIAGCSALGALLLVSAVTIPSFADREPGPDNGSVLGEVLQYPNLGRGAMLGLVLLAVPVIHLMAQAVRVGAPARDARLAAMRSAGATRGDVRAVVLAEALVWSLPGAAIGVAIFYAVMALAPRWTLPVVQFSDFGSVAVQRTPVLALPEWPHPLLVLAVALLAPVAASALLPLASRRVVSGAAGQRRADRHPSRVPVLALLGITTVTAVVLAISLVIDPYAGGRAHRYTMYVVRLREVLPLVASLLLVVTCVAAAPAVAVGVGGWLARRDGATAFLAGRMMQARPRLAARTAISLVLVALVGGVAVTYSGIVEVVVRRDDVGGVDAAATDGALSSDVLFYTVPFLVVQILVVMTACLGAVGLLIAVAEQVSLRGADLARQVALGVPRSVLRRALVVEVVAPVAVLVSAVLAIAAVFALLMATSMEAGVPLDSVHWGRLVGLWVILVGGATLAAWVGGLALPATVAPQRIRDRG